MIVLLTMLCALGFSGCGNQTTAEQSSSTETVVTTTDAPVTTTAATTTKHGFDVIKNIKVTTTAMEEAPEMNLDQTETVHGFSFLCDSNRKRTSINIGTREMADLSWSWHCSRKSTSPTYPAMRKPHIWKVSCPVSTMMRLSPQRKATATMKKSRLTGSLPLSLMQP